MQQVTVSFLFRFLPQQTPSSQASFSCTLITALHPSSHLPTTPWLGSKWSLDLDKDNMDKLNDEVTLLRNGMDWLRSNLQACLEVYSRKALVKVCTLLVLAVVCLGVD